MAVPSAPVAGAVVNGDNTVTLPFTPGTGDPAVTKHQYQKNLDGWVDFDGVSPLVLTGLKNDVQFSLILRAVNEDGNSAPSAQRLGLPTDSNPNDNNGFDDNNPFANPFADIPNLDWNDPDD